MPNPSEYRSRAQAAEAAASLEPPGPERDELMRQAAALYEVASQLELFAPAEVYRKHAEALLLRAAETQDPRDRSLLITEAAHWHKLAVSVESASS